MATIALEEAAAHVGGCVRFVAAVQQVATGKRVLVARQRVQSCHVLHVGDASRQFFKVTCWGDAPPTLIHSNGAAADADSNPMQLSSADAALRVGDIVLFSDCRIKSYRGNVEAQFVLRNDEAATSSTAQLLYRKDRYFSTHDVPLKDLYPMIDWYKQHCREFIEQDGSTTATAKRANRSTIKDLRENMVASVICKLRLPKNASDGRLADRGGFASELDGVLLCELIMYDSARDIMTINLWDQHAEKNFVTRLLNHRGAVEIDGIVVSLQALSNRLLANTTPHTVFRLVDVDDPESIDLERKLTGSVNPLRNTFLAKPDDRRTTFATFEELENSTFEGQATLENVRIEQLCLGRNFGDKSKLLAKFAVLLTEGFCTGCDQALPELSTQGRTTLPRHGTCASKCETRRGSAVPAPCGWRYRRFTMILRDSRDERLQVQVGNQAAIGIVGNIEAEVLVGSRNRKGPGKSSLHPSFDVASAVTSLFNALVEDSSQKFEAQLLCTAARNFDSSNSISDSYQDSSHDNERTGSRVMTLVSLIPSDAFLI
ncbi:unnamed protein product [Phytophthora lilii]|uniref:Unnamed protein product n=1 Tax=Phytophthora lilii TaxID=2077276 RepID=A0A9W6YJT1_9STRA|nr:unnamed protein product [Phytophthora lilii]